MPDFPLNWTLTLLLAMGLILVGCADSSDEGKTESLAALEPQTPASALSKGELSVHEISDLMARSDYEQADAAIRSMLSGDPNNATLLFMSARSAHDQGRLDEAIESLKLIPPDHPEAGFPAMGQTADWLLEANRLLEAEAAFDAMLEQYGELVPVHRRLADLLNSQGRRVEAARHVDALVRLGDVTEKELLGLTTLSVPYHDELRPPMDTALPSDSAPSSDSALPRVGQRSSEFALEETVDMRDLAYAKEMLVRSELAPAADLAKRLRTRFPHSTAVAALEGRVYEALQRDEELRRWSQSLPAGIEREAEYWTAVGAWMLRSGKPEPAIRAFGEAVTRDPTDRVAYLRMSEALAVVGEMAAAERVAARKSLLDDAWQLALNVGLNRPTRIIDMRSLAETLDQLGRPWEAVSWRLILAHETGDLERAMPDLMQRRKSLAQSSIDATTHDLLCGLDIARWPLPAEALMSPEPLASLAHRHAPELPTRKRSIEFVDIADQIGIDFRYQNNREPDAKRMRMSQVNGGGIAVLDYDRDGSMDLYFCDAGGRANDAHDSNPNRLYRNLAGTAMKNVSAAAAIEDRSYSLGTTAIDWNQDGFPDLVVANIGENLLYINNGDGSFTGHAIAGSGGWTSGVVCGDLDGDALPEMVEINYIDDEDALTAKCWGEDIDCTPRAFDRAVDRILTRDLHGDCVPCESLESQKHQPSFGFAGLIANFDRHAGNDLFITNDTLDNEFWVSRATDDDATMLDRQATLRGCAVGDAGLPQGCMGCAGGDFDRDGNLDLCVTNYWNEPSNLYLQRLPGFFTDGAAQLGIAEPSRPTVGFGIQAVDLDRDGWLDLTVLNGHVFDPAANATPEIPFQMLPQLFQGGPDGFQLVDHPDQPAASPGLSFWMTPTLGRTLARVDVNGDGIPDLIANSLDAPVAILENRTETGHGLRLELVGTTSERDAIGAEVIATCGDQAFHSWMLAGGYMAANEPTIDIGLGEYDLVDQIEVHWPSGQIQSFTNVPANATYLVIEHDELLHNR